MKKLGLYLSAQNHLYLAGPSLVKYWGPSARGWTTPVKAYLDAGHSGVGGTDAAVVPYPPLWVIYHFVTRDTITGGVLGADQKISREDALRLVTRNHWYLTFEENTKGMIAPGRLRRHGGACGRHHDRAREAHRADERADDDGWRQAGLSRRGLGESDDGVAYRQVRGPRLPLGLRTSSDVNGPAT